MTSSAWNQLDQLLTCAICLDRYRNPTLLPCQHTFCLDPCLDGLIDYGRRLIKCPECRAEHRIPYKGIQEFPLNDTTNKFLELYRDITGEEVGPTSCATERCSVCSEKSELQRCAHCDKKICTECREAHVDVLRREINRISSQVKRACHRLSEAMVQNKKNAEKLEKHCQLVKDEIDEIVRRYSRDLKHTEEKLKRNLKIYAEAELTSVNKLKRDLGVELYNMTSNCEMVEKYLMESSDESDWTDVELLEYKEIFLKMLDFLRNMNEDKGDFCRRFQFQHKTDPCTLYHNIAEFGVLTINSPRSTRSHPQQFTNAISRSQSDHRISQFSRQTGVESENECCSKSAFFNRGRLNYFSDTTTEEHYHPPSYYTGQSNFLTVKNSSNKVLARKEETEAKPKRFLAKTVRFEDDIPIRKPIFEDSSTGPMSGVIRLVDSPKFQQRLRENERLQKQVVEDENSTNLSSSSESDQQNPIAIQDVPTNESESQLQLPDEQ